MKNRTAFLCLAATIATQAGTEGVPPNDYADTGDPVLDALIVEAVTRNPRILELEAHHLAARHGVRQATALPDPVFTLTRHLAPVETRVGPQFGGIAVSQALPWFGKRTERGRIAEWAATVRMYEADRVVAETVQAVKTAYYELGYIDEAVAIAKQEADLLRHYETLAQARYAQGIGLQQAVVKLQAAITRSLSRRAGFSGQRVDIETTLNSLRDRPPHTDVPIDRPRSRPALNLDDASLAALGTDRRPELRAADARVRGAASVLRLSRQARRPDVVVGAAWSSVDGRRDLARPPHDNGDDAFSVSVGINIPIYRAKRRADDAAALAALRAAEHAQQAMRNRVLGEIRSASNELTVVDQQISLFERTLLPQAEQALSTAEDAYSSGTAGILDLLDSEAVVLDVRMGRARLNADYFQALAALERATGGAVSAHAPRAEP